MEIKETRKINGLFTFLSESHGVLGWVSEGRVWGTPWRQAWSPSGSSAPCLASATPDALQTLGSNKDLRHLFQLAWVCWNSHWSLNKFTSQLRTSADGTMGWRREGSGWAGSQPPEGQGQRRKNAQWSHMRECCATRSLHCDIAEPRPKTGWWGGMNTRSRAWGWTEPPRLPRSGSSAALLLDALVPTLLMRPPQPGILLFWVSGTGSCPDLPIASSSSMLRQAKEWNTNWTFWVWEGEAPKQVLRRNWE